LHRGEKDEVERPGISFFFNPRSIALVGASEKEGSLGRAIVENLIKRGFQGKIFPVNPAFEVILGIKSYPDIMSLPETPDLSVVLIPAKDSPRSLESHGIKGIKNVIIISAGFRETGESGRKLEQEILRIAKRYRIRVVGPNCLGVFDNVSHLDTFFVPEELVKRPAAGVIALASQSGSFAGHAMDLASFEHLGICRVITYGNRIDVNEADALDYFSNDPNTRAVGIYIEGVDRGREFLAAAKRCARIKPVVVLKTGKYEATRAGITSHTGVIAGSYAAYKAAFVKAGLWEADSLESFIDFLKATTLLPLAHGKRALIVGHAGGLGLTMADHCISHGLEVPKIDGLLLKKLKEIALPYASVLNPVDLTASGTDEQTRLVLNQAIVESDRFDLGIYLALWGLPQSSDRIGRIILESMRASGKPIVVASLSGETCLRKRDVFESIGVPVFLSLQRAANVAALLAQRAGSGGSPSAGNRH
jgi:acyl-CoA synthetase (NDP forming)